MIKKFEELIQEAKKVKLEEKDKISIRRFLLSFIEKNSVMSVMEKSVNRHQAIIKPEAAWSNQSILSKLGLSLNLTKLLNPMTVILLIAAIIAGGVGASAENSLPGDLFFPVKISVNEKARTIFAFSDEAKAKVEVRLAERRLEEAAELAAEGRLNAETSAKVESNFEAFAERLEARIEKMKAEGKANAALEATSNFEAALKAHEAVLENLAEIKADTDVEVHVLPIKSVIELKLKAANENRIKIEEEIKGQAGAAAEAAAEAKINASANKISEVRAFIDKAKAELGLDPVMQAEARLKLAEEKQAQGKVKLEAGAFGEAFVLFQEAHQMAQEAKLLIKAEQFLELKLEGVRIRLFASPSPTP